MEGLRIKELVNYGTRRLEERGIETPRLDSELILAFVLGKDRMFLYLNPGYRVEDRAKEQFTKLIEDRADGKPLQYITGYQEFMGLDFHVNRWVLIPRPDTEVLVEILLERFKGYRRSQQLLVADIGTGSGAIAVSLAYYDTRLRVVGTDISQRALEVARLNARKNSVQDRVEFLEGDLFRPLEEKGLFNSFDAVVSNPPYIPTEDIQHLQREVRFEPIRALDGGRDGLYYYRRIAGEAPLFLKKGGLLALEIGYNQADDVTFILEKKGIYSRIEVIKDLGQRDRVVIAMVG